MTNNTEALPQLRAEDYLDQPHQLQQELERRGALQFTPYASGLYPASHLSRQMSEQTGMGLSWARDNGHIGAALYAADQKRPAIRVAGAMLSILRANKAGLDEVVHDKASNFRLPVRVDGDTLDRDAENRVQHDSTGYMLSLPSNLIAKGAMLPSLSGLEAMSQTVRYLKSLEYWHDADAGAWEEGNRIHASSIAVAMGGIRDTQRMFNYIGYQTDIDFAELLENGKQGYRRIFAQNVTNLPPNGQLPKIPQNVSAKELKAMDPKAAAFMRDFDIAHRRYDAALLFGAVTMEVFGTEEARQIVADVKANLVRPHGVARYIGDTYWAPGFKELLKPKERTTSAPGRLEMRDAIAADVAYAEAEAQWTLFDPLLSVDAARQYLKTVSENSFEEQLFFLNRHLDQLETQPDGTYKWTEARYWEFTPNAEQKYTLRSNDHTPLLWTQANSLQALKHFAMTATMRKMARE